MAATSAAPASAAVTIGAPLDLPPNVGEGCEAVVIPSLRPTVGTPDSCTFWGLDLSRGWSSQTPPGRWVITRARIRAPQTVGPMVITAVEASRSKSGAGGIICCVASAESQIFTPAPNAISTVPVRVPVKNTTVVVDNEQIEVIDYLGFSMVTRAGHVPAHVAQQGALGGSASMSFIAPAMRAGQQRLQDGAFQGVTPLLNADFEPDLDGDGLGDETQDSCPLARATAARRTSAPRATTSQTRACVLRPRSRSVRASRSGRVSFVVIHPAVASKTRRATFTLRRRTGSKSRVGRVRIKASPGNRRTVRIKLTRSGRRSLAQARSRKLRLRLEATYPRSGPGKAIRAGINVTIRRR